ncbi:MAG: cyclic nucleotide-binding domain-containing protein [Acidimicrobiales bacterium]
MSIRKPHPVIDLLRTVPALSTLPDRALARMVPFVEEAEAAAGAVVVREGVVSREAFIVLSGTGTVFVDGEIVAKIGPGEFVGEMEMLDCKPRSATVRADTSMRLLVVGPKAFGSLVAQPTITKAMATQLSQPPPSRRGAAC